MTQFTFFQLTKHYQFDFKVVGLLRVFDTILLPLFVLMTPALCYFYQTKSFINLCQNFLLFYSIEDQQIFRSNKRNYKCKKVVILSHNHGHNILKLFKALPNFPFTTSETKGDY